MHKKATWIFVFKLIGTFLFLGTSVVMNRLVGIEEFGKFVFLMGFVNVLVVVVCFGGDRYLKRAIGRIGKTKKDSFILQTDSVKLLRSIFRQLSGLWVISLLCIWLFLHYSFDQKNETLEISFVLTAFLVLGISIVRVTTGVFIGLSMPVHEAAISSLFRPLVAIFLILLLMSVFGDDAGLTFKTLLAIQVVATMLTICLAVFILTSQSRQNKKGEVKDLVKENFDESYGFFALLKQCFPLALVSSTVILERNIDILMLGYLDSADSSALYFVCTRISALFLLPLFVLNSVVMPAIAKNSKTQNYSAVEKKAKKVSCFAFLCSIFFMVFAALLGERILVFFGEEYLSAYIPMMVLCVGNMIRTSIGPSQMVALMLNMDKIVSRVNIISVILNIFLNVLLIPLFGIYGAVYATIASRLFRSSFLAMNIYRSHSVRVGILCLRTTACK